MATEAVGATTRTKEVVIAAVRSLIIVSTYLGVSHRLLLSMAYSGNKVSGYIDECAVLARIAFGKRFQCLITI